MDFPVFPDLWISSASCLRESIDDGFGKLLIDPIRSANVIHLSVVIRLLSFSVERCSKALMLIAYTILCRSSYASSSTGVSCHCTTSRTSTAFEVVPGDGISGKPKSDSFAFEVLDV